MVFSFRMACVLFDGAATVPHALKPSEEPASCAGSVARLWLT